MKNRLNILAFAYVFPPDAGSGTYRTLYFANQWARQGDGVTIVTVEERCFLATALIDRNLSQEVDPAIHVVRASAKRPLQKILAIKSALRRKTTTSGDVPPGRQVSSSEDEAGRGQGITRLIKDTMTDLLACPDEHVGWVPDAVRRAYRITKTEHVDCVYATGGPWSSLLAALIIRKLRGIPLVLDFRDPWISNPNMILKSPLSRWIQGRMESMCVKASSLVVANTEELRRDFMARYGDLGEERFITVTNGFENIPRVTGISTERFTLVHAGALYQSRNPLNFLKAVIELVNQAAIPAEAFRVELIGGVSVTDPAVEAELRSKALRDVLEITPRVAHDEALARQQRASALLLIQTGFPLQVPRKLYEYLSLARPVLAITEPGSATARMVSELRAGYVVGDEVVAIKQAILKLYEDWKTGKAADLDEERLRMYGNQYLANRLRDAMRGLVDPG